MCRSDTALPRRGGPPCLPSCRATSCPVPARRVCHAHRLSTLRRIRLSVPASPREPRFSGYGAAAHTLGVTARFLPNTRVRDPKSVNETLTPEAPAVKAAYYIGDKARIVIGAGRYRLPDGLTTKVLSEVKNVAYQSWTRQLEDYASYASQRGLTFDLYVRSNTTLSSSVRAAEAAGRVNIKYIPGM